MTGYVLLRCLVAALIFLPVCVHAHDIYEDWLKPDERVDGKRFKSCCNNTDCQPYPSRFHGDRWEVLYKGGWLVVPNAKVETEYDDAWDPGDHRSYACISNNQVLCFRPGEWMQ